MRAPQGPSLPPGALIACAALLWMGWKRTDAACVSCPQEQQESARAVPESTAPLLDVFSSMLKDTTSQHRAHLFDLNCKICTGEPNLGGEARFCVKAPALVMVAVCDPA